MSAIWFKILLAIDHRNQVIQARDATIDVETNNLDSLLTELNVIRDNWTSILDEAKNVAKVLNINTDIPTVRKRKRVHMFNECDFETVEKTTEVTSKSIFQNVFYKIIDSVIVGLAKRYKSLYHINEIFKFLWNYLDMNDENINKKCNEFGTMYGEDLLGKELRDEIIHLKTIHRAKLCEHSLDPHSLINTMLKMKLEVIFPNICTAVRIFLTLPVAIASAERSFS